MDTITLKIDQVTLNKMENFYCNELTRIEKNYILWKAKTIDDVNITIYYSKNGFKALFSGDVALKEAKIWSADAKINEPKKRTQYHWLSLDNQIGSDEVGTGDFFGPIIVVASYIEEKDIPYLKELNVNDSKKISDEKILQIVPLLLDKIIFSKLTLSNIKYNQLIKKGYSMNKIKAILHNHALKKVRDKIKKNVNFYVDQFCDVDLYFSYLSEEKEVINHNITFKTKGESQYPSIAVSSMIARYCFLKELSLIGQKYNLIIPKGASEEVDRFANDFIHHYGISELEKIAKINFKNYLKLKNKS